MLAGSHGVSCDHNLFVKGINIMSVTIFVGSCGYGSPDPKCVVRMRFSLEDGTFSSMETTQTEGGNPGWIKIVGGDSSLCYIGMEDEKGTVQAYSISKNTENNNGPALLTPLGSAVSSCGRDPCYIEMCGKYVLAANYSSGSVSVLPIKEDGSLGPATDSKGMTGGELINPKLHDRQEMCHSHCIIPNGVYTKWVAVCDLGLSTVFIYELDQERGCLIGASDDPRHMKLDEGAGCRHAVWSADGSRLYLNNELNHTLTVCSFDHTSGNLVPIYTTPSLPETVIGSRGHNVGNSDINLHPNQKFLYAAMRSPNPGLIGVWAIKEDDSLELVQHISTGGHIPRNFKIISGNTPDAPCWLVVGNQETMTVVSFSIDNTTGKLTERSSISTQPFKACNISCFRGSL